MRLDISCVTSKLWTEQNIVASIQNFDATAVTWIDGEFDWQELCGKHMRLLEIGVTKCLSWRCGGLRAVE